MSAQVAGVIMVAVGVGLLWSAWAFVAAGVLLLVAPEVLSVVARRRVDSNRRKVARR